MIDAFSLQASGYPYVMTGFPVGPAPAAAGPAAFNAPFGTVTNPSLPAGKYIVQISFPSPESIIATSGFYSLGGPARPGMSPLSPAPGTAQLLPQKQNDASSLCT